MRKGLTVFAVAAAGTLLATTLVIGATTASATSEPDVAAGNIATMPVVATAPTAEPAAAETCGRKVRVIYAGYGTAPSTCTATR